MLYIDLKYILGLDKGATRDMSRGVHLIDSIFEFETEFRANAVCRDACLNGTAREAGRADGRAVPAASLTDHSESSLTSKSHECAVSPVHSSTAIIACFSAMQMISFLAK